MLLDLLFLAIKAPLQLDSTLLAEGAALLGTGAAAGLYLSRKQLRKFRRKMMWSAVKDRFRGKGGSGSAGGGCLVFLVLLLLIGLLAIFLWKVAVVLLIVLLIVWLVKRLSAA